MRHVISVILENEVGALTRMTGLFSTRGYNIESLNVAPIEYKDLSRVTLVISGSNDAIEQLNSQLSKLVDVVGINNMSFGEHFERELLIVKVKIDAKSNNKIQELSQNFNAEILDRSPNSFTIQLTAEIEIIDDFVLQISKIGDLQAVARSGSVSVSKGEITLTSYANKSLYK